MQLLIPLYLINNLHKSDKDKKEQGRDDQEEEILPNRLSKKEE